MFSEEVEMAIEKKFGKVPKNALWAIKSIILNILFKDCPAFDTKKNYDLEIRKYSILATVLCKQVHE
jgi:hypothetical protein